MNVSGFLDFFDHVSRKPGKSQDLSIMEMVLLGHPSSLDRPTKCHRNGDMFITL